MLFLSIDVGIKNLAYIIYETKHIEDMVGLNKDLWCLISKYLGNNPIYKGNIIQWDTIVLTNKNCNKVSLIELGREIDLSFKKIFNRFKFDKIIIENQIGKNAIRMKCIQSMITMFFINYDVEFWNSRNKLKRYNLPSNTTYPQRKKYSINITKEIINIDYNKYYNFFCKHKKKDDLADCFLQVIDYILDSNY